MHRSVIFSLLIGTLFSVVGFYLAFRHVPLSSLAAYTRTVDYRWTLPALSALAVAYFVRSLRWKLILRPIGAVPLTTAYHSIVISFMINSILPGRIGEFARPLILKKKEGLPFAASLAALAAERFLDLATLLALLAAASANITFASTRTVVFGQHELNADLLMHLARSSGIVLILLLLGLIFFLHDGFRQRLFHFIGWFANGARRFIPHSYARPIQTVESHIITLLQHFSEGLRYLKTPGNLLTVLFLSLAVWQLNALSFYLLARGCSQINLGYADILAMMVIICLFISLPSVPGYWGLWEAAGIFVLTYFQVAHEPAAGFTLFNHAFQILPVIATGWISFFILGFKWSHMQSPVLTARPSGAPVKPNRL